MKNILLTVASIILGVFFFIVAPGIGGYIDTATRYRGDTSFLQA